MNAKKVIFSYSFDPNFKNPKLLNEFVVESFIKSSIFQKIPIKFEVNGPFKFIFCKFAIDTEDLDIEQDVSSKNEYVRVSMDFGFENYNNAVKRIMAKNRIA